MQQTSRLADVMFWLMVLLGAAVLAPCLILPAWLEYQASLDLKTLRAERVKQREAEIERLRAQREHIETDDAYVLRLAREHLNIEIPGVKRVPVDADGAAEQEFTDDDATASQPAGQDELLPEVSALIEEALVRYPVARMFVRKETRPTVMLLGGGLIVTAIVLLGAPVSALRQRRRQ